MRDFYSIFLTRDSLASVSSARAFLDLVFDLAPDLAPSRYGHSEPVVQTFSRLMANDDRVLAEVWTDPFLWAQTKTRIEGLVLMKRSSETPHGIIYIAADSRRLRSADRLPSFVKEMSTRLKADFALAHILVPEDVQTHAPGTAGWLQQGPILTVTSEDILYRLPNLYWATVLGPSLSRRIGRHRFRGLTAPMAEELEEGMFYLQLTPSVYDSVKEYGAFSAARQVTMMRLGLENFTTHAA